MPSLPFLEMQDGFLQMERGGPLDVVVRLFKRGPYALSEKGAVWLQPTPISAITKRAPSPSDNGRIWGPEYDRQSS